MSDAYEQAQEILSEAEEAAEAFGDDGIFDE
jgi:vacuolar-type H+-ATPase subunit H